MEIIISEAEEEIPGGLTMIEMFQMMMAWEMTLLGQEGNNVNSKYFTKCMFVYYI